MAALGKDDLVLEKNLDCRLFLCFQTFPDLSRSMCGRSCCVCAKSHQGTGFKPATLVFLHEGSSLFLLSHPQLLGCAEDKGSLHGQTRPTSAKCRTGASRSRAAGSARVTQMHCFPPIKVETSTQRRRITRKRKKDNENKLWPFPLASSIIVPCPVPRVRASTTRKEKG